MPQIERITQMEQILDEASAAIQDLENALARYEALLPRIRQLESYYTGTQWRQDFEDDSVGKLPASLKRGVLSEDAVYDLLTDRIALRETFRKLSEEL